MTPDHARAACELLAFYAEAGVDALVGEEPLDRLAAARIESEPAAAAPPPILEARTAPTRANPASAPATPEIAVMAAREAARSTEPGRTALDTPEFEGCALRAPQTSSCSPTATREAA